MLIYFIYRSVFFHTYGPMEMRWRKWHRNAFYVSVHKYVSESEFGMDIYFLFTIYIRRR